MPNTMLKIRIIKTVAREGQIRRENSATGRVREEESGEGLPRSGARGRVDDDTAAGSGRHQFALAAARGGVWGLVDWFLLPFVLLSCGMGCAASGGNITIQLRKATKSSATSLHYII